MPEDSIITFAATIASMASAIKFDGSGGGARIQLDLPETENEAAKRLLDFRNILLLVAVKEAPE